MARKPAYPKRITARMLRYRDACDDQLELFEVTFSSGFEVTRPNLAEALRVGLDFDWALDTYLAPTVYDKISDLVEERQSEARKKCWDLQRSMSSGSAGYDQLHDAIHAEEDAAIVKLVGDFLQLP